jgi:hypothetical protein
LKTEMEEYLKTAGPEADEIEDPRPVHAPAPPVSNRLRDPDAARKASACIAALGGKANIDRVDACAETRLRLVVRDEQQIRETDLKVEGIKAHRQGSPSNTNPPLGGSQRTINTAARKCAASLVGITGHTRNARVVNPSPLRFSFPGSRKIGRVFDSFSCAVPRGTPPVWRLA